jgi:hypothetical protein
MAHTKSAPTTRAKTKAKAVGALASGTPKKTAPIGTPKKTPPASSSKPPASTKKPSPTPPLVVRAREIAWLVLQSAARRYLGALALLERRRAMKVAEAEAQQLLVRDESTPVDEKYHCTLDELARTLDTIVHLDGRVPFAHGTTTAAHSKMERVLNFSPGWTLRRGNKEDMSPDKLRRTLASALREGLPLIIDLDDPSAADEPEPLLDICGDHFPAELFTNPRAIHEPEFYLPLLGRAGGGVVNAAELCAVLGVEAGVSDGALKKAYHKLAKAAHPDKGGNADDFVKIQEAYEALSNGHGDGNAGDESAGPGAADNATSGAPTKVDPNFKIILMSRQHDRPPPDVARASVTVWVTEATRILVPQYNRPAPETRDLLARAVTSLTVDQLRQCLEEAQQPYQQSEPAGSMKARLMAMDTSISTDTTPIRDYLRRARAQRGQMEARYAAERQTDAGPVDRRSEAQKSTQAIMASVAAKKRRMQRQMFAAAAAYVTAPTGGGGGGKSESNATDAALAMIEEGQQRVEEVMVMMAEEAGRVGAMAQVHTNAAEEIKDWELALDAAKAALKKAKDQERTKTAVSFRMKRKLEQTQAKVQAAREALEVGQRAGLEGWDLSELESEVEIEEESVQDQEEKQAEFEGLCTDLTAKADKMEKEVKTMEAEQQTRKAVCSKEKEDDLMNAGEVARLALQKVEDLTKVFDAEQAAYMTALEQKRAVAAHTAENDRLSALISDSSLKAVHKAVFTQASRGNSKALVEAAFEGELTTVLQELMQGYDLESVEKHTGYTALSEAACAGNDAIVELLLSLGADPNTFGGNSSSDPRTPLYRAAFNGRRSTVELLLQSGAYAEQVGDHQPNEIVALLQEWPTERTPQAQQQRFAGLEAQLTQWSQDWSHEERRTLVLNRARARLVQFAADGDAVGLKEELERLAVHEAETEAEMARELVTGGGEGEGEGEGAGSGSGSGADAGAGAGTGVAGSVASARTALQTNVAPPAVTADLRDAEGGGGARTLLATAAWKGHYAVVEMLLREFKTEPELGWETPHTTVTASLSSGGVEGPDPPPPADYAGMRRRVFQVDVNARFTFNNAQGWTPFAIAAFCGHADIVELLRRNGANPLLGTTLHQSAFSLAALASAEAAKQEGREQLLPALEEGQQTAMDMVMLEYVPDGPAGAHLGSKHNFLLDRAPASANPELAPLLLECRQTRSKARQKLLHAQVLDGELNQDGEFVLEVRRIRAQRKEVTQSTFYDLKYRVGVGLSKKTTQEQAVAAGVEVDDIPEDEDGAAAGGVNKTVHSETLGDL